MSLLTSPGLYPLIKENCPDATKEGEIKTQFGRKIAIDASMYLYSFLVAVRSSGEQLMNESGETTSHLIGIYYRTLRLIENGIKPVYVFDGAPPKLKSGELAKRFQRKSEAQAAEEEAKETGTAEDVEKFSRRAVKVTREHNAEAQRLLKLMGVPYIIAPTEAEAQCAVLAREGKVYAAASEDMDTLTFAATVLVRKLTSPESKKEPVQEIHLDRVLEGFGMDQAQFIDFCILLGCDYLDPLKGVGPKTALTLIKEHKTLENVVEHIKKAGKITIPDDWPYQDARQLFLEPDVRAADHPDCEFKWEAPDEDGLVKFLVEEKGFSEERVRGGAARLKKNLKSGQQSRLEGFFKVQEKTDEQKASLKRKNDAKVEAAKKQKKDDAKAKKDGKAKPKMNS